MIFNWRLIVAWRNVLIHPIPTHWLSQSIRLHHSLLVKRRFPPSFFHFYATSVQQYLSIGVQVLNLCTLLSSYSQYQKHLTSNINESSMSIATYSSSTSSLMNHQCPSLPTLQVHPCWLPYWKLVKHYDLI